MSQSSDDQRSNRRQTATNRQVDLNREVEGRLVRLEWTTRALVLAVLAPKLTGHADLGQLLGTVAAGVRHLF